MKSSKLPNRLPEWRRHFSETSEVVDEYADYLLQKHLKDNNLQADFAGVGLLAILDSQEDGEL